MGFSHRCSAVVLIILLIGTQCWGTTLFQTDAVQKIPKAVGEILLIYCGRR